MAKVSEPINSSSPAVEIVDNEKVIKLVAEMLAGNIVDIRPEFDFTGEPGFVYPIVEQLLAVRRDEVVSILESMADRDILKRDFFDKFFRCPQCQSAILRPSTRCPKCGSGNVTRGKAFEHFACKFIGLGDEFVANGGYICPRCGQELRVSGGDYQSLGLMNKCHDCYEVFSQPEIQWRCLKCGTLTPQDKVNEVNIYSYSFNEAKRGWLEFELKPKLQLIKYLKRCGYEVKENAEVKGRPGAEHGIDILATRNDGIITHHIAIGIEVAGELVGLDNVFDFDNKAYDIGILDKVFIAVPGLTKEARQFAQRQKIRVFEVKQLEPSA